MNDGRKFYEIWSGTHFWSDWTKPVLFATGFKKIKRIPNHDDAGILLNIARRTLADSGFSEVVSEADDGSKCCVIIDYPGKISLGIGAVLSTKGFAPIVLFNGVFGPQKRILDDDKPVKILIDNEESVKALVDLSEFLENTVADPSPAFLLDSVRQLGEPEPNIYDNRWITFPQDFPSGKVLVSKGINKCFLLTDSSKIPNDLCHVLYRWQQEGIIFFKENNGKPNRIEISKQHRFGNLFYRMAVLAGFRPHSFGGFGNYVPDPSQGGYG